jgi:putative methyltransferase (TIGR04325 family)
MKDIARLLTPPLLLRSIKMLVEKFSRCPVSCVTKDPGSAADPEWEYVADTWAAACKRQPCRGWNDASIVQAYEATWRAFTKQLQGPKPLGISPEAPGEPRDNLLFHNSIMTFGYALALAAQHKENLHFLDWGGGLGHYFMIAQTLLPDVVIDYVCKDLPLLTEAGRTQLPAGKFYHDDSCLAHSYDFVLASGSLQFAPDWRTTLSGLARASKGYCLVANLPIIEQRPSFVFIQRPYCYGYRTEYLAWCLNETELLDHAAQAGLRLIREFVVGHRPLISNAPEQNEYRSYLFRAHTKANP